jgi:hypothetical protein
MLGEIAEDVRIHLANHPVGVDPDSSLRLLAGRANGQQGKQQHRQRGTVL